MSSQEDEAPVSDLINAAINYLIDLGIEPTMIGGLMIEHDPDSRTNNHRLVIGFTAKLPVADHPGQDMEG